jgi:hypothetical protein
MTIRFAARAGSLAPRLEGRRARAAAAFPANDNGGSGAKDALLNAALRHFAQHGLAAAGMARSRAETAFFAGDREAYRWWLEICRALDRRMAAAVDFEPAGGRQRT